MKDNPLPATKNKQSIKINKLVNTLRKLNDQKVNKNKTLKRAACRWILACGAPPARPPERKPPLREGGR